MKYYIRLFLIVLVLFTSCKKTDYIKINGYVFDKSDQSDIDKANVTLFAKGIASGVYSSGFRQIAKTTSNPDGYYEMNIPKEKSDSYKLIAHKDDYFSKQIEFSANVFDNQSFYEQNLELYSSGYIQLRLINKYPYDENDLIVFYFTNADEVCADCCSKTPYQGIGEMFDTTIVCKFYGNMNIHFVRNVKKDKQTNIYTDSLYCPAFSLAEYTIEY